MRAARAEVGVRNAQTTTLPLPSGLPFTADFFLQLSQADLTAAGYRVLFWHMARWIRHRTTSEAVPLETIAQALGLHRNAVGKAYAALTAAGLVRRQEVRHRGAPTRTCVEGPALQVVLLSTGKRVRSMPITSRSGAVPVGTSLLSQLGQPQIAEASADHAELQDGGERVQAVSGVSRSGAVPVGTGPLSQLGQPQIAETSTDHGESQDGPPSPAIIAGRPGSTEAPAREAPAFSAELQAQALAKLPSIACYDAMQGRLTPEAIEEAWGLSADERAYVLSMRQREARPKARAATCIAPVPTKAPSAVAAALLQHRAHFEGLVDAGALSQLGQTEPEGIADGSTLVDGLLDQIAFMIVKRGLGRGDVLAGVRAARSLVAKGRWTQPWDFTRDWHGAVRRGSEERVS